MFEYLLQKCNWFRYLLNLYTSLYANKYNFLCMIILKFKRFEININLELKLLKKLLIKFKFKFFYELYFQTAFNENHLSRFTTLFIIF